MTNCTYRSIFVSDIHFGTRDCKADQLNNFLKHNTCETLYLVGDIIDVWKITQNKWRWEQAWQIFRDNLVEKQPRLLF